MGLCHTPPEKERVMKDETAKQIADTAEQVLKEIGISVEEIFKVTLRVPLSAKHKKLARIGVRHSLVEALKTAPEPTKSQRAEVFRLIEALKTAPYQIRSLLIQRAKALHHAPGGPPKKLSPAEEGLICAEVAALRGELGNREAVRRIAREKHVSERTIYRILRQRGLSRRKS